MAVNRFGGSFKVRTDILDNITPNVVVQPNVSVPAGEWKPVPWLPVEWQGEASKDGFVISAGKVVSLTTDGYVIPSGYRAMALRHSVLVTTNIISYTQTDVDLRVQDVTTGEPVTEAKNVSATEVVQALMARGILAESDFMDQGTAFVAGTDAHVRAGLARYVSPPVGVCAYDVYTWAGTPEGGDQALLNYNKQHLIQFLTDVQLQVPLHCTVDTNSAEARQTIDIDGGNGAGDIGDWSAAGNDGFSFPDADSANGVALFVPSANLDDLTRYSSLANVTSLCGFALPAGGAGAADGANCAGSIAANTDRTPVTFNAAAEAVFLRERSSAAKCTRNGDWFWDNDAKMLLVRVADPSDNPCPASCTVTYSTNQVPSADLGTQANEHRYTHASGDVRPGCYMTYDGRANFVPVAEVRPGVPSFSDGGDGNDQLVEVIGRCLAVVKQPRGLLDRVRTAWEGSSFAKDAQMPGTATKGFTDLITLSGQTVADTVCIINVKCQ